MTAHKPGREVVLQEITSSDRMEPKDEAETMKATQPVLPPMGQFPSASAGENGLPLPSRRMRGVFVTKPRLGARPCIYMPPDM